jgi:hypothetical protein
MRSRPEGKNQQTKRANQQHDGAGAEAYSRNTQLGNVRTLSS